jgi:hypothetical protein
MRRGANPLVRCSLHTMLVFSSRKGNSAFGVAFRILVKTRRRPDSFLDNKIGVSYCVWPSLLFPSVCKLLGAPLSKFDGDTVFSLLQGRGERHAIARCGSQSRGLLWLLVLWSGSVQSSHLIARLNPNRLDLFHLRSSFTTLTLFIRHLSGIRT